MVHHATVLQEIDDLVELCGELMDTVTDSGGREFIEDVRTKAVSISETVENNRDATDRQYEAIQNMSAGVKRWRRD